MTFGEEALALGIILGVMVLGLEGLYVLARLGIWAAGRMRRRGPC